jgi:Ca2+-binding RTX toxin-like protein
MPTPVNGTVTGGAGDDSFYFGANFDAQDVADGGSGGTDRVLLQGNYNLTIVGSMLVSIEKLALLSGDVATYGDPGTNFYDYVLATSDDVLSTGERIVIDGNSLRPGEDFGFNGSAELSGSFQIFAGRGQDRLIGGNGDDEFVFLENRFGTGDQVTGNGGDDTVVLRGGSGLNLFGFQGAETTGVEKLRLISGSDATFGNLGGSVSYIVELANGNVAAGATLIIDGAGLGADETISIDGSGETDGALDLTGGAAADELTGGWGADSIDGGAGSDQLTGGPGDDAYSVEDAGDSISELSGEGNDTVSVALSTYTIPENVENLAYTGLAAATLSGNSANNVMTGGPNGDLFLLQQGGNDNASGGSGDDTFYFGTLLDGFDVANGGGAGADRVLVQGNQSLTLSGTMLVGIEKLVLLSGTVTTFGGPGTNRYDYSVTALDNVLTSGQTLIVDGSSLEPGEDFTFTGSAESTGSFQIYAGSGADNLAGGNGDDQFIFNEGRFAFGDKVVGNGGNDTFVLRGNHQIAFQGTETTGIERLRLISGSDICFGAPAQSFSYTLQLADGNVGEGATLTVDGSALGGVETVTVDGSLESNAALVLLGGGAADELRGGTGNDRLNGGSGVDELAGGAGNDTYVVDSAQDAITEASGAGSDTVESTITYTLGDELENLTLIGSNAANGTGNGGANILKGNAAANLLDGKSGTDTMIGGGGDDIYVIDDAGDVVVEAARAGSDTARTSVNYVLAGGVRVETLTTASSAGTAPINLTGNEFANKLIGNAGANTLNGKGGADTLTGGGGNDTYVVDTAADKIVETATSSGSAADVARASASYVLGTGVRVENLQTTNAAGTGAINLTGNEFRQVITGNDGANALSGKGGNDTIRSGAGSDKIFGGSGNDLLFGGAGRDRFHFDTAPNASANLDRIGDFNAAEDSILLKKSIFAIGTIGTPSAATPSTIKADAFKRIDGYDAAAPFAGPVDPDGSDRIIYDQAAGKIYYDADGSGSSKAILFATVDPGTALSAADFLIFI